MKEILIEIDGKKISALVEDKEWQKLVQPVTKTGYEVVKEQQNYWTVIGTSEVHCNTEVNSLIDRKLSNSANYYSDRTVAENNARADKLMRQLRKFAVEHREKELDWSRSTQSKFFIYHCGTELDVDYEYSDRCFGCIYFDTYSAAKLAIDAFKDELLWYFTAYKDSL